MGSRYGSVVKVVLKSLSRRRSRRRIASFRQQVAYAAMGVNVVGITARRLRSGRGAWPFSCRAEQQIRKIDRVGLFGWCRTASLTAKAQPRYSGIEHQRAKSLSTLKSLASPNELNIVALCRLEDTPGSCNRPPVRNGLRPLPGHGPVIDQAVEMRKLREVTLIAALVLPSGIEWSSADDYKERDGRKSKRVIRTIFTTERGTMAPGAKSMQRRRDGK